MPSGLRTLIEFIKNDNELQDVRQIAYMLATVKHETAGTFEPIKERGTREYFAKYEFRRDLGNLRPGDGYLYIGRGYCQITGFTNYKFFGNLLGVPLLTNPHMTLQPDIAYKILSHGMRKGKFTGKALSDYINIDGCDFVGARRIINGTDRAELIATYAAEYLRLLFDGGFDRVLEHEN